MQVYLALLVIAPKVLLQAEYNKGGPASLPSSVPLNPQQQPLRDVVHSPVSLPFRTINTVQDFIAAATSPPSHNFVSLDAVSPDGPIFFPNYFQAVLDMLDNTNPLSIFNHSYPLSVGSPWILTITSLMPKDARFTLSYTNGLWNASVSIASPTSTDLLEVSIKHSAANGANALQMGDKNVRLEIADMSLVLKVKQGSGGKTPTFSIGGRIDKLSLSMQPPDIIPLDGLHFETDISADYIQGSGLRTQGSASGGIFPLLGIEFAKVLNTQLGSTGANITIERIVVRGQTTYDTEMRARVVLQFSATLKIGPISMTIADAGAWFGHWVQNTIVGIQPLDGVGIAINAADTISGGGFLKKDGNSYSGALSLKLLFLDVFAFGIYTHKEYISFIAVLGARFPGIQLSFGFMLTGVGGLVGINKRANTDLLRERLASGASGNVLFCEDPLRNTPTLLGDLAAFFPDAEGVFVVGPTLQITWLYLVRFDLGVFIELPKLKIFILGSAKAIIGFSENAVLLYLRMDVFGEIDFARKLIAFDAHLINSTVLDVLNITGGAAFRLNFGDSPYILLSIGGFHERFNPGPIEVPRLERAGASLSISVVANIWLRLEMYFAFTSNSLQLGAHLEAGLDIGPLSAHGFMAFDALIQFRPFHFDIEFHAGLDIEAFGVSWASVTVDGTIIGPGPLVVHAHASVKRLFIKVSASATFTLGSSNGDKPTPISHVVAELQSELDNASNVRAEGDDPSVLYTQERAVVEGALVSPMGSLIWEQKKAPLDTTIDRLGGIALDGPHQLSVEKSPAWTDEYDLFNPGAFTTLDESTKLNNATFQKLPAGVRVSSKAQEQAPPKPFSVTIDLHKITHDENHNLIRTTFIGFLVDVYMTTALTSSLQERANVPNVSAGQPIVKVKEEQWNVYNASGQTLAQNQTPFQAFQIARNQIAHIALPNNEEIVKL